MRQGREVQVGSHSQKSEPRSLMSGFVEVI